jgi:hypothetical protein
MSATMNGERGRRTMTDTVVVRYTTHRDRADENERLIRAVFAEMAERMPAGFRYTAARLEDGVTFVHVATVEGENPLASSAAFAAFVSGISDRCTEPPVSSDGTAIGAYSSPD